jgi:hypothetical protein
LLPNGHALTMGYYLSEVDMSRIANGGHPAALVSGTVIQELDAQRNAVFQWRSWDHYDFEDHTYANPTAAMLSEFHINNINLDIDATSLPARRMRSGRSTARPAMSCGRSEAVPTNSPLWTATSAISADMGRTA